MQRFQRDEARPAPFASFLWQDAETGDRLSVSIRLAGSDPAGFFADLEADGFLRVDGQEAAPTSATAEMTEEDARRSNQVGTKDGEDGGTLPCSIDVISAFHAAEDEQPLVDRSATDEDPSAVRRESA